jgi:hypothetical protein
VSWPKGSGIAIARPTRVLVFGKKSELKLVSHTAVASTLANEAGALSIKDLTLSWQMSPFKMSANQKCRFS